MTMQPGGSSALDVPGSGPVDFHAQDLLMVLCSLIVEGRVPTPNDKGRREGPHVAQLLKQAIAGGPAAREKGWKSGNLQEQLRVLLGEAGAAHSDHDCNPQSILCKRRGELHRQVERFSEKGIPICVEVLLAPDCQHGDRKAEIIESPGEEKDTILLEKWDIIVSPKKHNENVSSGRMLIQAFRSYLHFSQLSSWYNTMKGQLNMNTVYRIFAPGDDASSWFTENPETHEFPLGIVSKSQVVRAKVMKLPRRQSQGPNLSLLCGEKACQDSNNNKGTAFTRRSPDVELAASASISGCKRDGAGSPLLCSGGSVRSRHGTPEPFSGNGSARSRHGTPELFTGNGSGTSGSGGAGGSPKLANLLTPPENVKNPFPTADLTVARLTRDGSSQEGDPAVRPRRPSGGDGVLAGGVARKEKKLRKSSFKRFSRQSSENLQEVVLRTQQQLPPADPQQHPLLQQQQKHQSLHLQHPSMQPHPPHQHQYDPSHPHFPANAHPTPDGLDQRPRTSYSPAGGRHTPTSCHSSDSESSSPTPFSAPNRVSETSFSSSSSAYEKELRKTKAVLRQRRIGLTPPSQSPPSFTTDQPLLPAAIPFPASATASSTQKTGVGLQDAQAIGSSGYPQQANVTMAASNRKLDQSLHLRMPRQLQQKQQQQPPRLPLSPPLTPQDQMGKSQKLVSDSCESDPFDAPSTPPNQKLSSFPLAMPMTSPKVLLSETCRNVNIFPSSLSRHRIQFKDKDGPSSGDDRSSSFNRELCQEFPHSKKSLAWESNSKTTYTSSSSTSSSSSTTSSTASSVVGQTSGFDKFVSTSLGELMSKNKIIPAQCGTVVKSSTPLLTSASSGSSTLSSTLSTASSVNSTQKPNPKEPHQPDIITLANRGLHCSVWEWKKDVAEESKQEKQLQMQQKKQMKQPQEQLQQQKLQQSTYQQPPMRSLMMKQLQQDSPSMNPAEGNLSASGEILKLFLTSNSLSSSSFSSFSSTASSLSSVSFSTSSSSSLLPKSTVIAATSTTVALCQGSGIHPFDNGLSLKESYYLSEDSDEDCPTPTEGATGEEEVEEAKEEDDETIHLGRNFVNCPRTSVEPRESFSSLSSMSSSSTASLSSSLQNCEENVRFYDDDNDDVVKVEANLYSVASLIASSSQNFKDPRGNCVDVDSKTLNNNNYNVYNNNYSDDALEAAKCRASSCSSHKSLISAPSACTSLSSTSSAPTQENPNDIPKSNEISTVNGGTSCSSSSLAAFEDGYQGRFLKEEFSPKPNDTKSQNRNNLSVVSSAVRSLTAELERLTIDLSLDPASDSADFSNGADSNASEKENRLQSEEFLANGEEHSTVCISSKSSDKSGVRKRRVRGRSPRDENLRPQTTSSKDGTSRRLQTSSREKSPIEKDDSINHEAARPPTSVDESAGSPTSAEAAQQDSSDDDPLQPHSMDEEPRQALSSSSMMYVRSPTDGVPLTVGFRPSLHSAPLSPLAISSSSSFFLQEGRKGAESGGDAGMVPSKEERQKFRSSLHSSATMLFHKRSGLPLNSSPAPLRRSSASSSFDYDSTLTNPKEIHNVISCSRLSSSRQSRASASAVEPVNSCSEVDESTRERPNQLSRSAPASTNCLLGNFEESVLNGRLDPVGVVEGFSAEIGASGTFCPKHVTLPVTAFYFQVSEDNAPSPYLGHINLEPLLSSRGYKIPRKGTIQVTLFNPNKTVVKMFVVMYDLSDMPPNSQTFLRQRTVYMPTGKNLKGEKVTKDHLETFLRYLIHLRIQSSKSGHIYLHTDIRMIFARNKFDIDSSIATYELRSFTEGPTKPKFSPKR